MANGTKEMVKENVPVVETVMVMVMVMETEIPVIIALIPVVVKIMDVILIPMSGLFINMPVLTGPAGTQVLFVIAGNKLIKFFLGKVVAI